MNHEKSAQEISSLQNENLSKDIKKKLSDELWQDELFQQFVCTVRKQTFIETNLREREGNNEHKKE
jgi:hypothetical protein